jgi:hypothetical protein
MQLIISTDIQGAGLSSMSVFEFHVQMGAIRVGMAERARMLYALPSHAPGARTRVQVMRNAHERIRLASLAGPLASLATSVVLGLTAGALVGRVMALPARPFGWALRRLPAAAGVRVKARPATLDAKL